MKVSELIEKLQTLDKEKDIHIVYDGYANVPFDVVLADEHDAHAGVANIGDYIINAW